MYRIFGGSSLPSNFWASRTNSPPVGEVVYWHYRVISRFTACTSTYRSPVVPSTNSPHSEVVCLFSESCKSLLLHYSIRYGCCKRESVILINSLSTTRFSVRNLMLVDGHVAGLGRASCDLISALRWRNNAFGYVILVLRCHGGIDCESQVSKHVSIYSNIIHGNRAKGSNSILIKTFN